MNSGCATVGRREGQGEDGIARLASSNEAALYLQTIPGFGAVTALTVVAEVGDVRRFREHRRRLQDKTLTEAGRTSTEPMRV